MTACWEGYNTVTQPPSERIKSIPNFLLYLIYFFTKNRHTGNMSKFPHLPNVNSEKTSLNEYFKY